VEEERDALMQECESFRQEVRRWETHWVEMIQLIGQRPHQSVEDRLRELVGHYNQMRCILEMLNDKYSADVGLLRRIGLAVGTSQFDEKTVIKRADQLMGIRTKNAELIARNQELVRQKAELQDELNEDCCYD
jgi:FtsZ-binding cell division protein ZapB